MATHILTAALLLSLLLATGCGPWTRKNPATPPSTFTTADAEAVFASTATLWKANYAREEVNGKFWQFGNALHSLIRFLAVVKQQDLDPAWVENNQDTLEQMVSSGHDYFFVADGGQRVAGMWVDDFGWWGLMFLAAHDTFQDRDSGPDYVGWAADCWRRIHALCQSNGSPVTGGCWNHDGSGAVQNSIVNALYLTLSVRLYRETGDAATYLSAIAGSTDWFLQWIDPATNSQLCPATVNMHGVSTGLLRNTPYPIDPTQLYPWSVQLPEQAILFAGLAEFAAIDLPSSASAAERDSQNGARKLLEQLSTNWPRLFTAENVLQVPPFAFNFGPAFSGDMLVGKGPFLRYALEAEAALLAHGTDLTKYYQPTADAAWATRQTGPVDQLSPNWVPAGAALAAFAQGFYDFYTSGSEAQPACQFPPSPYIYDPPGNDAGPFLPQPWSSYGFAPQGDPGVVAMTEQTLGLDAMAAALAHW